MQRVKKPKKKKEEQKPRHTIQEYIELSNKLNMAVVIKSAHALNWSTEALNDLIESYAALMSEVYDKRITVSQFVKDAEEETGIEISKIFDKMKSNNYYR